MPESIPHPADPAPATAGPVRRWLGGEREVAAATRELLPRAARLIRCADLDGALFALSDRAAVEMLHGFLLAGRDREVRLLLDRTDWWERSAARLRGLHRQFQHALRVREASSEDPVGEARMLVVDAAHLIEIGPRRNGLGEVWSDHPPRAELAAREFDRRWEAATHDLGATVLGL